MAQATEPEDAFNLATLKTRADWEKFGEFLFSFSPYQTYSAPPQFALDSAAKGQAFAFVGPEGPVAPEFVIRQKGKLETVVGDANGGCVECHSQTEARRAWQYPSWEGMRTAVAAPTADLRRQPMLSWYGTPWLNPDPNVDVNLTGNEVQRWLPDELNQSQAVADWKATVFGLRCKCPS